MAGLQDDIVVGIPMASFSFLGDLSMVCQKDCLSCFMMMEPSSGQQSLPMAVAMALTLGGQMMGFFSSVRSGKQGSVSEPFSLTPCPEAWGFVPKGSYRNTPKRFGWLRPIDLYTHNLNLSLSRTELLKNSFLCDAHTLIRRGFCKSLVKER